MPIKTATVDQLIDNPIKPSALDVTRPILTASTYQMVPETGIASPLWRWLQRTAAYDSG